MKLCVKAFAATCGIIWGLGLFFLTWWVMAFEGATRTPTFLGQIYRGYNISPMGSFIGLIWGAADGFVGGAIFAWLYNQLVKAASKTQIQIVEKAL